MHDRPILLWLRRDLRLSDHPALLAAVATGRAVVPIFIHDPHETPLGAAPRWRLGQGLERFGAALQQRGARLVLRRGPALGVLRAVIAETGAGAVYWSRQYDGEARARDGAIKAALRAQGIEARSFAGWLLSEPWEVMTGQGGAYRVYTPFWKALRGRDFGAPEPAPGKWRQPEQWPHSERLSDWALGAAMQRGGAIVARHAQVGEAAAQDRLGSFIATRVEGYGERRDYPALNACSGLSENLAYGEISPRQVWHQGMGALVQGRAGAERFLQEVVWREFAAHLMYHFPELARNCWRGEWEAFGWRADNEHAEAWRRGMTGEPFVDAAMREMFVTGTMHNRSRMIVASYLCKHLLTDWRVGRAWFETCLIDWDPASNAMGWQWVAGSGPDAAPYFRVFNPAGQAEKFDPQGSYRRKFIAEGHSRPEQTALDFFAACPPSWGLSPDQKYPAPLIELAQGRARALAAYADFRARAQG